MENVTRTAYGAYLQSCLMLGTPFELKEYTTLNEKFGIQAGVALPPNVYPKVNYFCIGNGGHGWTMGTDNIPLTKIKQHKATDAALFNQLPFVLRQVGNDLTPADRVKYALRKELVVGGNTYIAYYLRRVDMSDANVMLEYRNVNNGIITTTPFIPSAENLNPTAVDLNNSGVNTVNGDYVTCTSQMPISFSPAEIDEFMLATEVLYGDINYAIISEIGLCSGYDKVITVSPSTGVSFNFTEAIGVQIASHITAMHPARYSTNGIEKILDVGSNLPMYSIV